MVGAEADLVLGEDHPARHLSTQRPLLERAREAGQAGAGQADRDGGACAEVPGAADDLLGLGIADIDLAELEPVGARMRLGGQHAPDDEMRQVVALVRHGGVDDPLDLERRDRQPTRDLAGGRGRLDELAEPRQRDFQNCLANRRSLRQSSRRSGNSCRSIAIRSRPHPNAKPVYRSGS